MNAFWTDLPRPFFVLAPMDDVTDAAFRRMIASHADSAIPRVIFTEFVSADGLVLASEKGQEKLRRKLMYSGIERPSVAQLFTSNPEHMEKAARIVAELGFDGIDINMGCPDRTVEKTGSGAALIKKPSRARELIRAARDGVRASGAHIPVSVKTRLGYNADQLDEWLPELLAEKPDALTLHARTRKEMSLVPARWERIAHAVQLRDALSPHTLLIGNGDVRDLADARQKARETGCDGVMLGRAAFGNPWLFTDQGSERTARERMEALALHLTLFEELLADVKNYAVMKKHFKAYISGWHNAKELRERLMETEQAGEARAILEGAILGA